MSVNIPNWFIQKYNTAVELRAQQRQRRLAGVVSGGGSFIGDHVYFPRAGSAEMYDSQRMAQIALANASQDWIEFNCKPKFCAFGIWDPDKTKLSISAAESYAQMITAAGFRAEDKIIIEALNHAAVSGVQGVDNVGGALGAAETITTLGDYNTEVDLDLIAQGVAQLGTNEMFEGEKLIYVSPFKVKTQLSLDPYKVFSNVNSADLPWSMLDERTYERLYDNNGTPMTPASILSGATTGVDTYLFAQSAVVSDYNNDMTKIDERWGAALTDIMGQWFQAGAGVREPKGLIRIKSKYNFNIARGALPFVAA